MPDPINRLVVICVSNSSNCNAEVKIIYVKAAVAINLTWCSTESNLHVCMLQSHPGREIDRLSSLTASNCFPC